MSEIDFQKLAEPFARHEVKSLTKRYQDKKTKEWREYTIRFITARSVMNRLDAVVGPQNWRAEFKTMMLRPDTTAVQCTLFLRIDGEWVGKSDIGTESDIEPEKGAVSDAMKRAAVHWGIGRELYGEGTAYDALGEQRTIDGDTGEVTRSEAQPTTRGERSTHNPPKPSVADELPPAAQEPCRALAPLSHFIEAVPVYDGRVVFYAPGVFVPSPTVAAARWLAQFLEV